jgi:perosamine synthetase
MRSRGRYNLRNAALTSARVRRHGRVTLDVAKLGAWFATNGRTAIADGSGVVGEFESEFRAAAGSHFALAMNSGTAALHSAYFAVGVGPGTEVIVPAYTWHASATPVLQCGAVPVFCDIDPDTLTIDVADMSRRITARTRAVCVVHMWGNPAELDRILEVASQHGIAVVEDCSHAHGAQYDGRPVGSWGSVGCFSLHASKPVAGGEAGVAVTNDPVLFDRMLLLGHPGRIRHGQAAETFDVDDVNLGVKYRPHAFAMHLAKSQLRRLSAHNDRCARIWDCIVEELRGVPEIAPVTTPPRAVRGGYYAFVVSCQGAASDRAVRDEIVARGRAAGVPIGVEEYAERPLHKSPVFTSLDRRSLGGGCFDMTRPWDQNTTQVSLPNCESLSARLLRFDPLMYMASERYARHSIRRLRAVITETLRDA